MQNIKVIQYFFMTDPRDVLPMLKSIGIPDTVYDENIELGGVIQRMIHEDKIDASVLQIY